MSKGVIRIIGGEWRSRKVHFPLNTNIKPTADRIRETLFNWLAPFIEEAYCLDLFSGSGALGLEALSRKAAWVGFIDHSRIATDAIHQQIKQFKATERACVYHQPYQKMTTAQLIADMPIKKKINLLFLDPPFQKNMLETSLDWLSQQCFIDAHAYLYLEHEKGLLLPDTMEKNWQLYRKNHAGNVCYSLWQRI